MEANANVTVRCENCGVEVVTAGDGVCHTCAAPVRLRKVVYNDSELTKRLKLLRQQGEVLFPSIASQLNRLQPGRERTEEEFGQVCIALALFVHHLLDSDGEEP